MDDLDRRGVGLIMLSMGGQRIDTRVVRLDVEGLQRAEIARRTGIGISSVYRVLAEAKKLPGDQKVA